MPAARKSARSPGPKRPSVKKAKRPSAKKAKRPSAAKKAKRPAAAKKVKRPASAWQMAVKRAHQKQAPSFVYNGKKYIRVQVTEYFATYKAAKK